jgi:hypothetical protein
MPGQGFVVAAHSIQPRYSLRAEEYRVKGTIRERTNKDGTVSFLCQVFAGRDPGSGKRQ